MKPLLINKVALVTGSTRGIGRAIARKLLANGAVVFINGRTKTLVDETISEWQKEGLSVFGFSGDVAKENTVKELIRAVIKECGRIDILINNAGGGGINYLEEIESAEWDEIMNNNLRSAFLVSKEVVPLMKKQKSGKIINISSTSGINGKVGGTHYSAAKSGLIGFTKSLALELGSYNIQVNSIAPGFMDTDRIRRAYSDNKIYPANMAEVVALKTPLGRIGCPDDVANSALFLSSGLSDFITGHVLIIDGGKIIQ